MLLADTYHRPKTLQEALTLWSAAPEGSRLLAGATDLLPWAREGRAGDVRLPALIDVGQVKEMAGYEIAEGRLRLGADLAFQTFLTDAVLHEHLPVMPYCAVWFADDQIRQQATLVGNIVNASPAADGTPPMLAMDGEVEIARLDGDEIAWRRVAVADFVTGPGRADLSPGEIVTAVSCPSFKGYGASFQKVGQRRSLVISTVCAAALVKTDARGERFEDVRLALGGIGPVPVRSVEVEERLRGQAIDEALIAEVSALPAEQVASRTRQDYRRAVVQGFVQAALEEAIAECRARHCDRTQEAIHA